MKLRLTIVVALATLWGALIVARLYELQIVRHGHYREIAEAQQRRALKLSPPRGTILDGRGRELAVSVPVDSAWVDPAEVDEPEELLAALDGLPEIDLKAAERSLRRDGRFAWIARKLDPDTAAALRERRPAGLHFLRESRRCYPMGELGGPLLGFVGLDPRGLEGLEAKYEVELAGALGERTVLRDARAGTAFLPGFASRAAEPGLDLHLTLDASLQYIAERELRAAIERHRAASGTILLLDPWSGAILAMASAPDFDPNDFGEAPRDHWRNRAVSDAYEPGSTFKVVTAAAALEANRIDPGDVLDCENGATVVAGKRIRDHKPFGEITFREVIARSSNVGAIKVGQLAGDRALYDQIVAFGLGSPSGVDLPGESPGIVHPAELWGVRGGAYISFGQGISVTPLQMANVFAAIANGGYLHQPYIVAGLGRGGRIEPPVARPVTLGRPISAATARTLERLLEAVVEEGTGRKAAIEGYRVAGKTGTAQIPTAGGYSPDRHIASFIGFAPARSPAVVGLVKIDEPRGSYHGGDVAAPVFAAVVREALLYLGVPPDRDHAPAWPLGGSGRQSAEAEAGPGAVTPSAPPAGLAESREEVAAGRRAARGAAPAATPSGS